MTPILREYRAVKERHPDAILLFRLGDFYELFCEDAERAAPIMGVTLTCRAYGSAGRRHVRGAGARSHGYLGRLLARRAAGW